MNIANTTLSIRATFKFNLNIIRNRSFAESKNEPVAALPVAALPVAALPVAALPVAALPVAALPVAALPVVFLFAVLPMLNQTIYCIL
jgi:hypothetical protein